MNSSILKPPADLALAIDLPWFDLGF